MSDHQAETKPASRLNEEQKFGQSDPDWFEGIKRAL